MESTPSSLCKDRWWNMEFNDLIQRALSICKLYRDFEQQNYGAS